MPRGVLIQKNVPQQLGEIKNNPTERKKTGEMRFFRKKAPTTKTRFFPIFAVVKVGANPEIYIPNYCSLVGFSDVGRFFFVCLTPKTHLWCPQKMGSPAHKFVGRQAPVQYQKKVALHQWLVVRHLKKQHQSGDAVLRYQL